MQLSWSEWWSTGGASQSKKQQTKRMKCACEERRRLSWSTEFARLSVVNGSGLRGLVRLMTLLRLVGIHKKCSTRNRMENSRAFRVEYSGRSSAVMASFHMCFHTRMFWTSLARWLAAARGASPYHHRIKQCDTMEDGCKRGTVAYREKRTIDQKYRRGAGSTASRTSMG